MQKASHALSAAVLVSAFMVSGASRADGARDWINLPANTQLLYVYLNHIESNTQPDTSLPIDGLSARMNMVLLRYAYSFPLSGRTSGVQFLLPYTWAKANIDSSIPVLRDADPRKSGAGDLTAVFAYNLFGGPAMSKQQFAIAQPETVLTTGLFLTMPTGQYDPDDIVNFGGNRWVVKPHLAFTHPFGQSMLSANANVSFYGENDRYHQPAGRGSLRQKPLATLEAHYSYSINRAIWVAADVVYANGGETKINGIRQSNKQDTIRAGVSGSMNFSPVDAIGISYLRTISAPRGASDVEIVSINYSHAW